MFWYASVIVAASSSLYIQMSEGRPWQDSVCSLLYREILAFPGARQRGRRGAHEQLSLSDKLHWHFVWDDEDKNKPAAVRRINRDSWYCAVNKFKVQPSSDTFIFIKANNRKRRRMTSVSAAESANSLKTKLLGHEHTHARTVQCTSVREVYVWERVKYDCPLLSGSTGSSRQYRDFMQGSAPNGFPQSRPSTRSDPQHIRQPGYL